MTTNKNFDLAKLRAEQFGQWLDEAFQTMLDFSLKINLIATVSRNKIS